MRWYGSAVVIDQDVFIDFLANDSIKAMIEQVAYTKQGMTEGEMKMMLHNDTPLKSGVAVRWVKSYRRIENNDVVVLCPYMWMHPKDEGDTKVLIRLDIQSAKSDGLFDKTTQRKVLHALSQPQCLGRDLGGAIRRLPTVHVECVDFDVWANDFP